MFALHSERLRRRFSIPTPGLLKRQARERQLAQQTRQEGERLARERREFRAREKLQSQQRKIDHTITNLDALRESRQELATYEPWGRAGGGAPNARGIRFTNIRDRGIIPEDELRGTNTFEASRRLMTSPARRQRRTPNSLRLREDPQLCYAESLRKAVDNDIRYRRTPCQQRDYKEILDDMVLQRQKALHEEMRRNLDYERKMHTMDVPWGRPGPGGTTWRNPRDIGLNFNKSMGWTDNEILNKLNREQHGQKSSSLTLPKVKYDLRDEKYAYDIYGKENYVPGKLPGIEKSNSAYARRGSYCGEREVKYDDNIGQDVKPAYNADGKCMRQEYNIDRKDAIQNYNIGDKDDKREYNSGGNVEQHYNMSESLRDDYNIRGKDGTQKFSTGAQAGQQYKSGELTRQDYNVGRERQQTTGQVQGYKTKVRRSPKKSRFDFKKLPTGEDIRCIVPDDYYNNCPNMEDVTNYKEKRPTPEEAILSVTGGVELVPLLARRRRVGARTLPSSDVTRPPEDSCQWREALDSEHLKILKHQMKVKYQQKEGEEAKIKRQNSAEGVRMHHETWASLWGRPGHGAPQQRGRYARSNLAQILYSSPASKYANAL